MDDIMTLGIFAHANAGKTTLTEQFLVHTNAKKTVGRVDHGTTTTDNLEIEQKRGISVKAAMVTFDLNGRIIQLIDTPGHVDFSSEVERTISVLDGAILVVSGVEGIEPQTRVIWEILREKKIPTIIFINKMDRLGADYNRVLNDLKTKLDENIVPKVIATKNNDKLEYHINSEKDFFDTIALNDDSVMKKYLDNEKITEEELSQITEILSKNGKIFLTYGGSALNDEGIKLLIGDLNKYLPGYSNNHNEFGGYIYKVDFSSGQRELYIKVLSGKLNNRQKIQVSDEAYEQISNMYKIVNNQKIKCDCLENGEIGVVTGLSLKSGDFIGKNTVGFEKAQFVNPLFETTITPVNKEDIYKLVTCLEILTEEDPELNACLNKSTGEITVKLMGNLQGEIIKNMIETRFGIPVTLSKPIILRKETPTVIGSGYCSYTRVSGVGLEVRPLPRNSGLVFKSELSTDVLFSKYQKQIERLVKKYCDQGVYGWEVTDAEIVLVNGKCDNVGSESEHFNIATPIAFARALADAKTKLLEPTIDYEITVSEEFLKNVIAYLYEKNISYSEIKNTDNICEIKGNAFLKDFIDLPVHLSKLTSGTAGIIERPSTFMDSNNADNVSRNYYDNNPFNEEEFLINMKGSMDKLDMGQLRRKKPRKKPNQIRH